MLCRHPPCAEVEGEVAVIDVLQKVEEAEEAEVWVATGLQRRVEQQAVLAVLEYDYSQRIDPDRVANPHGEHAEELFTLCGRDALREYAALLSAYTRKGDAV